MLKTWKTSYALLGGLLLSAASLPPALADKPPPLVLPTQTPLHDFVLDDHGVVTSYLGDSGKQVYNVFEVATEALGDIEKLLAANPKGIPNEKYLVPRLPQVSAGSHLDAYQVAALAWLEANKKSVGKDTYLWYYDFDNAYNDISVKSPWPSAFGQAYVIKAFMHAYDVTGVLKYKQLAIGAARAYSLPLSEGGFKAALSDGSVFFEEVPTANPPHILNAHLISTAALLEIGKAYGEEQFFALGQQGVATLRKHLADYDLGYWSRYDMNPKKGELIFRLSPRNCMSQNALLLDRASLIDGVSGAATSLDVGAGDDAAGAWRLSGTDWTQPKVVEGNTVRGIQYGPGLRAAPVKGGSIQNSYVIMQLPELKFDHLDQLPAFYLKLDYLDDAPGVTDIEIQDNDHGGFLYFRSLPNGSLYTDGDHKWKQAYFEVNPKALAWYMGPDYQVFHVQLLEELYKDTDEIFLKTYADRWKAYLDEHTETNPEASIGRDDAQCKAH